MAGRASPGVIAILVLTTPRTKEAQVLPPLPRALVPLRTRQQLLSRLETAQELILAEIKLSELARAAESMLSNVAVHVPVLAELSSPVVKPREIAVVLPLPTRVLAFLVVSPSRLTLEFYIIPFKELLVLRPLAKTRHVLHARLDPVGATAIARAALVVTVAEVLVILVMVTVVAVVIVMRFPRIPPTASFPPSARNSELLATRA